MKWIANLVIGFVVLPEGKHNIEDNVRNRRNDRVLLSLSLVQRSKKATFVRQDPVEIGKDFISELGPLFEVDNRQAGVEERSEEDLSITYNETRPVNMGEDRTHLLQRLQIGDILLLALDNLKNYLLALYFILRQ